GVMAPNVVPVRSAGPHLLQQCPPHRMAVGAAQSAEACQDVAGSDGWWKGDRVGGAEEGGAWWQRVGGVLLVDVVAGGGRRPVGKGRPRPKRVPILRPRRVP